MLKINIEEEANELVSVWSQVGPAHLSVKCLARHVSLLLLLLPFCLMIIKTLLYSLSREREVMKCQSFFFRWHGGLHLQDQTTASSVLASSYIATPFCF